MYGQAQRAITHTVHTLTLVCCIETKTTGPGLLSRPHGYAIL